MVKSKKDLTHEGHCKKSAKNQFTSVNEHFCGQFLSLLRENWKIII
jgi:hypothetical protein